MSLHLGAKPGQIATTVLLPGDPLRAKYVAENLLENASCYNRVRGMYGFTGTYRGKRVSVQGSGMGVPSISIYVNELISEYGAKTLIRIGTCGAFQPDLKLRDIILALAACTDSHVNKLRFKGMDYAPTATFPLLLQAYNMAQQQGLAVKVGSVLTSDTFYTDDPDEWKLWAKFGVLAAEMETAALYTLAAKFQVNALSILTVSDSLLTGEAAPAEAREKSFRQMVELALAIAE
ncbi:MAG: purine-nucleoside phosphorylase [Anaerolineae bacterium]|nr:purine-nucleoside phosphorylase [Anaerolineae bacterium]